MNKIKLFFVKKVSQVKNYYIKRKAMKTIKFEKKRAEAIILSTIATVIENKGKYLGVIRDLSIFLPKLADLSTEDFQSEFIDKVVDFIHNYKDL